MKYRIVKLAFSVAWLFLFYQIIFDASFRIFILEFCETQKELAPLILIGIQIGLAVLALPCSPISVLAGMVWGLYWGVIYSLTASVLASAITFLAGRYLFRSWLAQNLNSDLFKLILGIISRHKWKASAIAHVNPLLPSSSLGYFFGLTDIRFIPFMLGVLAGNFPLQVIAVGFGSSVDQYFELATLVFGVILTLSLVIMIFNLIKEKRMNGGGTGDD